MVKIFSSEFPFLVVNKCKSRLACILPVDAFYCESFRSSLPIDHPQHFSANLKFKPYSYGHIPSNFNELWTWQRNVRPVDPHIDPVV